MKFNEEEKKLIESIEKGEWKSIANLQKEIERSKQIAKTTLRKDQRMNIRISKRDIDALKIRAIEEGIPYQTLVSRIIHIYLTDSFEEKRAAIGGQHT
jgi:predicted DNA binding CopG/RHH family protein